MSDYFVTVLSSVGFSAVLVAILIFLSRTWIAERLKQSIQHEYDIRLEAYKATVSAVQDAAIERLRSDNARWQAIQATALASVSESRRAAHERTLKGIELCWESIIDMRKGVPPYVTLLDILLAHEYQDFFSNATLRTSIEGQDALAVTRLWDKRVEVMRPFMGEVLFSCLRAYCTIIGRVSWLLTEGFKKGEMPVWQQDAAILRVLAAVVSSEEVSAFKGHSVGQFAFAVGAIERRMIAHMGRIISGDLAVDEGVRFAAKVSAAIEEAQRNSPHGGSATNAPA